MTTKTPKTKSLCSTPGPWKLDLRNGCLAVYPATENHNCLAEARHWAIHYANGRSIYDENDNFVRHEMDAEVVANARLMSAAPDLLEACKAAFSALNSHQAYDKDCRPLLESAIQKAEGMS